jgi:peptidoglycan hydrolase-like protein with peptidoglycan-binding domain
MNKTTQKILFAVPILIGLALIAKQLFKKKASGRFDVKPPNSDNNGSGKGTNVITASPSEFPIKRGSRGEIVVTVQSLLNSGGASPALVPDGIFGAKTETALNAIYGKAQIDSQADLDALRAKIKGTSLKASNLDWAWSMVDAYSTGDYTFLVARQETTLREIKKNFKNDWVTTGKGLTLQSGRRYSLADYEIVYGMNDGSLRIYINKGTLLGNYSTDANIPLSQHLDIE